MSSSSSRSKSNSSPEPSAGPLMQSHTSPELRLRKSSTPSSGHLVLPQPPPQRQPQQPQLPTFCQPGDSLEDEERRAAEKLLKKDKGRLRLRRRFRKRRSDSPLGSSAAESRVSMSNRAVKFHRLFDIPVSEVLIRTFPCALKTEILLQGTFYVSASYFCFYARLANKKKTIKIPIRSVTEITREKTAIFFPNAIGIRTIEECRYVFGSIISRETILKVLQDLWKAALNPVENGGQPAVQATESARRIFRSASDSDLAALQSGPALIVKPRGHQNGDCTVAAAAAVVGAVPPGLSHHQARQRPHRLRQPDQLTPSTSMSQTHHSDGALSLQLHQHHHQQQEQYPALELEGRAGAVATRGMHWTGLIMQFVIFLKSHLSFILADNRMALGCSLIVLCLIYVLYLAYQIHMIQQTISERLEELLQSSAILSPLVQR